MNLKNNNNGINTQISYFGIYVHGLTISKAKEIYNYLNNFELIILVETFVLKLEKQLPAGHNWRWKAARRNKNLGRAIAGVVVGVRNTHKIFDQWIDTENFLIGCITEVGNLTTQTIGVYNRSGVDTIKKSISNRLDDTIGQKTIIVGDWNARTGQLGGSLNIGELERQKGADSHTRNSMDSVVDKEGRAMIDLLEDHGFEILNGRSEGDWEGHITHTDYRSKSVIDYAACNYEMSPYISTMKIGNKTQSDHFPIEIALSVNVQSS